MKNNKILGSDLRLLEIIMSWGSDFARKEQTRRIAEFFGYDWSIWARCKIYFAIAVHWEENKISSKDWELKKGAFQERTWITILVFLSSWRRWQRNFILFIFERRKRTKTTKRWPKWQDVILDVSSSYFCTKSWLEKVLKNANFERLYSLNCRVHDGYLSNTRVISWVVNINIFLRHICQKGRDESVTMLKRFFETFRWNDTLWRTT